MHVYALFASFSHLFMFGSMLVCLDLGLCHVLVCFVLVGLLLVGLWGHLLDWLHPSPLVACLDATMFGCTLSCCLA